MEIQIKNSTLLKPAFVAAVQNLLQTRRMPAKTTIEVNVAIDEMSSHIETLKKAREDVAKRYCSKNEEGLPVIDVSNNYVFPDEASKQECRKALDEVEAESVIVNLTNPIVIYDDEDIAPIELRLLGGLVEVKERLKV